MKVSKGNLNTKQVESNTKLATLVVTKVTLIRIALKLKLSLIRLSIIISHVEPKNDTSTIKMISSPRDSPRVIWVSKVLLTNHEGPNKVWVPKLTCQVIGDLRCIGSLSIDQKMQSISISQAQEHICESLSNDISRKHKCLPSY
jgi:hypothetical protein